MSLQSIGYIGNNGNPIESKYDFFEYKGNALIKCEFTSSLLESILPNGFQHQNISFSLFHFSLS